MYDQLVDQLNHTDVNERSASMLELIESLCNQNSGTYNLDGIAAVQQMLVEQYQSLGGELSLVDIPGQSIVDENGIQVEQPLGQAIPRLTGYAGSGDRLTACPSRR